ncbi:hypothetical protein D3M61_06060 [Aliarcobacter butzleri]|nr:hypothetical protein D3M61_06060 [Aliarcobacter butzleri]
MNYYNFKPLNIFKKNKDGKDIFFFLGNGYLIDNESKKNKLIDLMGSKYFYFSYKPPMLLISVFISLISISICKLFFEEIKYDSKGLIIILSLIIYLLLLLVYLFKIIFILKDCEKIPKNEKAINN